MSSCTLTSGPGGQTAPLPTPLPLREPGAAFHQVEQLVLRLTAGELTLDEAVGSLSTRGVHPWSLLGGWGHWDEVHREWADRLGLPRTWIDALGSRPCRHPHDASYNQADHAFRIPVDLGLEALPPNLTMRNLEVRHCPRLTDLGGGLAVQESLSLGPCGSLERLPDSLLVGGCLSISDCPSLHEVRLSTPPSGIALERLAQLQSIDLPPSFTGNLGLRGCPRLEALALPGGSLGSLSLDGCSRVRLPENLRILGPMDANLEGDQSLPSGLSIQGDFDLMLTGAGVVQLPPDLHVGGDLFLNPLFLKRLVLGPGLRVAGTLYDLGATSTTWVTPEGQPITKADSSELPPPTSWWV